MKKLVDVINFNADASCLSSQRWLQVLKGGKTSELYRWLNLYVTYGRKAVLGFTGASIADIAAFNAESLELINTHPEVFENILRPFSHDIALLRKKGTFRINFGYGHKAITRSFDKVIPWFLPPEFMCTGEQVAELAGNGVEGIFIHPGRFPDEVKKRLPAKPYYISGIMGRRLKCIPFEPKLTDVYLHSIHNFDSRLWNAAVMKCKSDAVFSWRDGESSFLLPDGLEREEQWLKSEKGFVRSHISALRVKYQTGEELAGFFRSYPVHSFSAWMQEQRMLGFVGRVGSLEEKLTALSQGQTHLWLQVINSDILSSVEKKSPVVILKNKPGGKNHKFTIIRSERGFEGEEFLALLERGNEYPDYQNSQSTPHMRKLNARLSFLEGL